MKRPSNVQLPMVDCNNREQQIRTYRHVPCDKECELYTTLNMKNKVRFVKVVESSILFNTQDGWTSLHYAADHGFVDILQLLLMAGECDVTIYNHVSWYRKYRITKTDFQMAGY